MDRHESRFSFAGQERNGEHRCRHESQADSTVSCSSPFCYAETSSLLCSILDKTEKFKAFMMRKYDENMKKQAERTEQLRLKREAQLAAKAKEQEDAEDRENKVRSLALCFSFERPATFTGGSHATSRDAQSCSRSIDGTTACCKATSATPSDDEE